MEGNHLTAVQVRQLKWLILVLTLLAITTGELIHLFFEGSIFIHIATWLIGIIVAVILIEMAFRRINTIQERLESASKESRLLERQQTSLLRLTERLANISTVPDICQAASSELSESLGYRHTMVCLVENIDGQRVKYSRGKADAEGNGLATAIPQTTGSNGSSPFKAGEVGSEDELASLKTRVFVPMQVGQKVIGELFVGSDAVESFSREDMSIITGVANQAALAIENSHLLAQQQQSLKEAERRESELRLRERYLNLLSEITRATLKSQDFAAMLQTLVEYLAKLMDADSALILLWDATRGQPVPATAYGSLRQVYRSIHFEAGELTAVTSALNSGRVLEVENTANTPYISSRIAIQYQIKSLMALPLIADNEKLGVALLSQKKEHKYSPREISLGEQAASQLALAIAKSRALDVAHHRAQELSALQKATAALLTTLDLEVLLGQILDAAISAIPVSEKGTLHLVARDTGQLQLRAVQGYTDPRIRTFNPTDSASFAATAVRERKSLLIHDAHADPQTRYGGDIPEIRAISSMIIAPLVLGGRTLGAISLDAYRRYAFTDSDLQLLVSFAATATTAIHNAQLYAEVQKQAITDALTGLYNRRGFFELGRREVERAHRFGRPLTAMMIDVDLFKQVNDTQGHLIGDQVLAGVAMQIERQLRQVDLPGRYGGDEFLALLPETDLTNAYQAAERLRRAISQIMYSTENEPVRVTVSIGLAELRENADTLETLIERADQALYSAKQSGRNRTVQEG
jgi:diguanylate cyclase (GGDEF)-like protein